MCYQTIFCFSQNVTLSQNFRCFELSDCDSQNILSTHVRRFCRPNPYPSSGVHHKKSDCDSSAALDKVGSNIINIVTSLLSLYQNRVNIGDCNNSVCAAIPFPRKTDACEDIDAKKGKTDITIIDIDKKKGLIIFDIDKKKLNQTIITFALELILYQ